MDRTGKIAIAFALIVLFGWQYFQSKKIQEAKLAQQAEQAAAAISGTNGETSAADKVDAIKPSEIRAEAGPVASGSTALPNVEKKTQEVASPSVIYRFTNIGGGIETAELLRHDLAEGGHVTMNVEGAAYGRKPIGALSFQPLDPADAWEMSQAGGVVKFDRTTSQGVQISKTFTPKNGDKGADEYSVTMELRFANSGTQAVDVPNYFVHTGAQGQLLTSEATMYIGFDWFRLGKLQNVQTSWFDPSRIPIIGIETKPAREVYSVMSDTVSWAGVKNQYFATIVSPDGLIGGGGWAHRFDFKLTDGSGPFHAIEGALAMNGFKLNPGEAKVLKFNIYSGPREFTRLKQMKQDEDRIMNYGMFRIVSETLLSAMHWLKGALGSYAVAIIVLTLIIKSVLWPIQNQATRSAKKMQLLSPRMKELQEKYKDDPVRMQQEVGKLYREYGVNPFSGCLPMLITIPIFFGFFYMLGQSIELRGSSFFWVHDLSRPDTIMTLAGFPVNILPIVMAATSFWQMALMPKSGDPMQQRMMMFMPLIFIAFCYNFASALALYYTVQNLFSIVQLYVTRNQPMPVLQKVNPAPTKKRK